MDLDRRPRYPDNDFGDDYELIENLLSGNRSCKPENNCNQGMGECAVPELENGVALAMVYSPRQEFEGLYEPMNGLNAGTIFKKLDKPFKGRTIMEGEEQCR